MQKFKEFFINSFFCYLAIELVEETIEELIVIGVSSLFIKGFSTLCVVSLTQSAKIIIKAIVKKITYKEGNDKMSKIKSFFTWIWSNKKTLLGTLSSVASAVVGVLSGTGVIDISALPELLIGSFNITPIIYYGILLILTLIGVFGKGFESIQEFAERIGLIKAEKEQEAIDKEAAAEIKAEEKAASQTQAEKEKAEAKAQAEAEAQAAKEQAEAEHRAKVEEAKARILAERATAAQASTEQVTTEQTNN